MPILGEGRKYRSELEALDKGVRRKPLEKQPHVWLDAIQSLALAAFAVLLLLAVLIAVYAIQVH